MSKKYKIEDYIGCFDGFLNPDICDEFIKVFNDENFFRQRLNRIEAEGAPKSTKHDIALSLNRDTQTPKSWEITDKIHEALRETLEIYFNETSILNYSGVDKKNLSFVQFKIQKTSPGGGYHLWHVEQPYTHDVTRILVYTVYLNDLAHGGETEFLLQNQRISSVKGRICFFPAHFPFVHRGNPPLKGDKYIITSWVIHNK
jgi:hypothetical protein